MGCQQNDKERKSKSTTIKPVEKASKKSKTRRLYIKRKRKAKSKQISMQVRQQIRTPKFSRHKRTTVELASWRAGGLSSWPAATMAFGLCMKMPTNTHTLHTATKHKIFTRFIFFFFGFFILMANVK